MIFELYDQLVPFETQDEMKRAEPGPSVTERHWESLSVTKCHVSLKWDFPTFSPVWLWQRQPVVLENWARLRTTDRNLKKALSSTESSLNFTITTSLALYWGLRPTMRRRKIFSLNKKTAAPLSFQNSPGSSDCSSPLSLIPPWQWLISSTLRY